jgi:hypothetical protein
MNDIPGDIRQDPGRWQRAVVIIVRVALVVFLLWALLSGKISTPTPVAGDPPTANPDDRSATESCDTPMEGWG